PGEKPRRIGAELPQHMEKLADAYHVLHGALATSRDKKVLAVMKEHYGQIERFFVKGLQDGQRTGAFRRNLNPRAAAWTLIISGIGYGMIALNLTTFDRAVADNAIEAIL